MRGSQTSARHCDLIFKWEHSELPRSKAQFCTTNNKKCCLGTTTQSFAALGGLLLPGYDEMDLRVWIWLEISIIFSTH